ncbi:hypothetical protein FALBO_9130 [Fusarium albosuccineum]|uniref:Aminoglycoside phosphotransferase domain-containing protein n=1 Tax=Fusarium albosuccineum TaxID=1237068 RepID=A0A8H4P683_9HYPO|nr:hypothetical protein FALBO_9130 [Fusarium albosuccineum]
MHSHSSHRTRSQPSSPDCSSEESSKRILFGPLLDISDTDLLDLAVNIREELFGQKTIFRTVAERITGTFNINHIIQLDSFRLVIRTPATGWGENFTPEAKMAIESHAATLKFVEKKTTIPAPKLYKYDVTFENEIKAPYICMSWLPGQTADKNWWNQSRRAEEAHHRTLETLAGFMAQLSPHTFDKIGSLYEDADGNFTVGPGVIGQVGPAGLPVVKKFGPFTKGRDFLDYDYVVPPPEESKEPAATDEVMPLIIPLVPFQSVSEGFVLPKPDNDLQNILVDHLGNVTGILDWDNAVISPRCIGNCSYPGWLWRDFDPLLYNYLGDEKENSPEQLSQYRNFYNEKLGDALQRNSDWEWNEKSHIREAIWLAATDYTSRNEIVKKLMEEALKAVVVDERIARPHNVEEHLNLIQNDDYYIDQWDDLRLRLKELIG